MTFEENCISNFEDLSDEIVISILEYLSLEDLIKTFGKINSHFASIVFDHPWTLHKLNIKTIDNKTLEEKLDFIENNKLTSKITSIYIQPFSIYHTIQSFNQYKSLDNFINLRALSVNCITLDEAELMFNSERLATLTNLCYIRIVFSYGVEFDDYALRLERLIAQVLLHPSISSCFIDAPRSIEFSQLQSSSSVEYLEINYCSFQSLYTLMEFTPALRHLTATVLVPSESRIGKITIPPTLNTVKLNLSLPAFDDLTMFLKRVPRLRKLDIVTHSVIEPLTFTSTWYKLVTESLPALIKFRREGNVLLENIEEYIEYFRWPNGWQLEEKSKPNGTNYSRITIFNTRF